MPVVIPIGASTGFATHEGISSGTKEAHSRESVAHQSIVGTILTIPRSLGPLTNVEPAPLVWIDVDEVSDLNLQKLASIYGIKFEHIKQSLEDKDPSSGYRYPHYLILRSDELKVAERRSRNHGTRIRSNRCILICGDNYVISIASEKPTSVKRVWSELQDPESELERPTSSNALAARIVGSNLHVNELAIHQLSKETDKFVEEQSSKLMVKKHLKWSRGMIRDLSLSQQALEALDDILDRLQEQRNLFGEPQACDAIDRYQRLVTTIKARIDHLRQELKDLAESWRSNNSKWQADVLFGIAVVTGLCTPIGVVSSVLGANFSNMPTDISMWTAIGVATVASCILVGALLFGRKAVER